ncbi:hypothetical protein JHK82_031315 [Glycine max]|nr:hypothetical protein JHK85_031967 [Glycine max]KAG4994579.1 hypothetical protein JHK86_031406 [Glycine max]KAG5124578.1 hypothetical protein JHK82_031315 [Glycine max]
MQAPSAITYLSVGIPRYHPRAPRLTPQQLYFGQRALDLPTGYGLIQQLLPGMRPGGYSKFHYVVPPIETGSSWAKGGYLKSWKSPTSAAKPDATSLTPTNQGFRYMGNGRNGIDLLVVPQGIRDHMMPFPFDGLGISSAPTDNQRHGGALSSTLASALAFVTQENQRLMLGEHLYPHVEQFTSNH